MFTWIQTYTGKKFDYLNPDVSMIDLKDIAHALARTNRFANQSPTTISVAEHCMYVSDNLPDELKLEGLLHDACEAYTGDIPSPLKSLIKSAFKPIEEAIEYCIADKFNLEYPWHQLVKDVDSHALYCEASHLFKGKLIDKWNLFFRKGFKADNSRLIDKVNGYYKSPKDIEKEFYNRATELIQQREQNLCLKTESK